MAVQTATTGQLENAQNIAIAKARYTMEHSMPCVNLVEKMTLKQGEKQITVPKVGQMSADHLVDGVDIVDTKDIGMTTTDLTTGEVGLKCILTDKLIRQENESVFAMIGVQMGDAMARIKDTDVIALFAALNGGTTLGADNITLTLTNLSACIAWAKGHKLPNPIAVVHHPYAIYGVVTSSALTPSALAPLTTGWATDLLKDFFKYSVNGVSVFEDGNIEAIAAVDSAYGAIFSKNAMVVVDSMGFTTKRDEDISLRATEVVVTADYGCFELDDTYGAPMRYEMAAPATNS
jgi:hypothetical protein